jgi:hypothetical protein
MGFMEGWNPKFVKANKINVMSMVHIIWLWYAPEYAWTINKNQIVSTLKVVVLGYFSMTNQYMEMKILNKMSGNSHMMTHYKTTLYKKLHGKVFFPLLAIKVGYTLILGSCILKNKLDHYH